MSKLFFIIIISVFGTKDEVHKETIPQKSYLIEGEYHCDAPNSLYGGIFFKFKKKNFTRLDYSNEFFEGQGKPHPVKKMGTFKVFNNKVILSYQFPSAYTNSLLIKNVDTLIESNSGFCFVKTKYMTSRVYNKMMGF